MLNNAGKGVERREQVVQGLQQADGQHPATQGNYVNGQKALSHALAHAHKHHHGKHAGGAALQADKAGKP